jgi:predicted thioesterase
MKFPGIRIGAAITIRRQVTESDTIGNHLPDDVDKLFSTPALVSLMIEASVRMVDPNLPDGFISIGKSSEVTHDHPSVVGDTIALTVRIDEFDGYHLGISMEAHDSRGLLGHGRHVRTIVNKRWMELKIARRIAPT